MQKDIVVLAKSRKPRGYCVAGVELLGKPTLNKKPFGRWVRPVFSAANDAQHSGALPSDLCESFGVLDVIRVNLDENTPTHEQPENWVATNFQVHDVAALGRIKTLAGICDVGSIWQDAATSRDDQVRSEAASVNAVNSSLMMIQPLNLMFALVHQDDGRRKVLASFVHNGKAHTDLPVTDPVIERLFKNQFPAQRGQRRSTSLKRGDGFWLTLSLSPEFYGYRYVLVAAVIDHTGYINRNYSC